LSFNEPGLEIDNFHPAGAEEFRKRILANDAFIISSPEYNGSIPGLLKNAIDWVSRFRPQPFNEIHALLISASPFNGRSQSWTLVIEDAIGKTWFKRLFWYVFLGNSL